MPEGDRSRQAPARLTSITCAAHSRTAWGVAAIAPPSIAATALIGAIPMTLAAVAVFLFGVETRNRRLEEITADELSKEPARWA